jgi:predicted dehydrogenase
MIRAGLVGYGYWGRNLARHLHALSGSRLEAVSDIDPAQLKSAAELYPGVRTYADAGRLIADPWVDAVVIATPPSTHFPLAIASLRAGKHTWIEKPMACNSADAETLIEEAAKRRLMLMVDHTFVYSPPVRKIGELLRGGELGSLFYYDSVRANLGRFQADADVLWDLAAHDFAILDYLLAEEPETVAVSGSAHVSDLMEVAHVSLSYPSGFHAHVHVSWLTPVKIRQVILAGSRRMLLWNDLDAVRRLEIYDHVPEAGDKQRRIGYRTGAVHVPWLEVAEPLETAMEHFLECIETGAAPLTDGEAGCRVVRLLERASRATRRL